MVLEGRDNMAEHATAIKGRFLNKVTLPLPLLIAKIEIVCPDRDNILLMGKNPFQQDPGTVAKVIFRGGD